LKGGGYGFLFRSEFFFRTTQELEYLFYLSREAQFFFPEFNIRLYDKNSESDNFFFPPPKSEYFFQQHWESEYFILEKNHTPPFKLNGRSLSMSTWFNTKYNDKYNMSMQIKKHSLKNEEVDTINILHVIKKNAYRVCTQNMCINYGTMTG
jgi:hypothetical protein